MNTRRRILLAIPCLALAGTAAMFIAYVIDAPPVPSAIGAVGILATVIGWNIWSLRHV